MPAFDVTTNPTKLPPLKPGDKAPVVVTATNRLTRAVTARANKVVDPKSFDPFVKPPANAQRTFPQAGATQDFQFTIEIPADAKAGSGTVRFDVVDIDQPDDNFGQSAGLQVVVEVPPPPPPPTKPKVPWWVWLIAGVVLIGIGIVIWRVKAGGKGKMPNVVGMTFEKARAKIGIDSTRIIRADTFDTDTAAWKAGIVIRQSPREGESLKPDTVKVRLAVEQPYAVVPVVKGLDGARAGAKIGAAGFALGLSSRCLKSSPLQDGTVVDVRPGEGTLQPRSTTVTLVILVIQPAGCFVINFDSLKIQQPYIQEYKRVVVPQSARSAVPISP